MYNDIWKQSLLKLLPILIFGVWFAALTVFYPLALGYRVVSLLILVMFGFWGHHQFRLRFFVSYNRGEKLIIRQRITKEISFKRVLTAMSEERGLTEILHCIMDEVYQLIPAAQTSSFVVYNPRSGMYEFVEVRSQQLDNFANLQLTPEEVKRRFFNRHKPFIDNQVRKTDEILAEDNQKKFQDYGVPAVILYIPIRIDGEIWGYITLDNWDSPNAFTKWDLHQIEHIQPQLVLAYSWVLRNAEIDEYKNKLKQLFLTGQELAVIDEPDLLIKHVLSLVKNMLSYNDTCIFLVNGDRLIFKGGYSDVEGKYTLTEPDLRIGEGICGWVARYGETLLIDDVSKDERYINWAEGTRSELAVPIKVGNEVLGVLNLENRSYRAFQKEDQELVMTIASQLGIALSNLKHRNDLKKALLQIIEALARSIEMKDNVTGGHCERMEDYAVKVGELLGFTAQQIENLRRAAILHDIGKIGVPGNILGKPGKLTDEEFKIMQEHPTYGANILREVDFLIDVATIVEQHHERVDGKGYPQGIAGEDIRVEARIISVVDAYDAMVSDRPYRKALTQTEAFKELFRHSGSQFDPEVVKTFLRVLEEEGNTLINRCTA